MKEHMRGCDYCLFDPFEVLHPYVYENILKHLSTQDLLNCSEVSTLWREVVTSSESFKKVKLSIDFSPDFLSMQDQVDVIKALHKSDRNYSHMSLLYNSMAKLEIFKFLHNSGSSVEALEVGEQFGMTQAVKYQIDFGKLKDLNLGFVSTDIFRTFCTSNLNLESFTLNKRFQLTYHIESIGMFLMTQSKLKKLRLICDTNSHVLLIVLTFQKLLLRQYPPFQLTELVLGKTGQYVLEPTEIVCQGLIWFLDSQKYSLEIFAILCLPSFSILQYIFKDLKINTLILYPGNAYRTAFVNGIQIVKNKFIKEMRIGMWHNMAEIEEAITNAVNLEHLEIEMICGNLKTIIFDYMKRLRTVEFNFFDPRYNVPTCLAITKGNNRVTCNRTQKKIPIMDYYF